MTPAELQDRLRASLDARAAEVVPDPATWVRVERRISRGVALRRAGVATVAAAVLAVAAFVVPALLRDRARVELDTGPVVQQPAALRTPALDPTVPPSPMATPTATSGTAVQVPTVEAVAPSSGVPTSSAPPYGGYVWTDGTSIFATSPDAGLTSTLAEGDPSEGSAITDLAVLPGSTSRDIALVYRGTRGGDACGSLSWGRYVDGQPVDGGEVLPGNELGCASTPVFSPDGRDLAWVEDDGDGTWTLRTIGWYLAGPVPSRNAAWDVDHPAPAFALQEWVWLERDAATAAGTIATLALEGEAVRVVEIPIARQADGALALVGPIEAAAPDRPVTVGVAHGRPLDGAEGASYALEVAPLTDAGYELLQRAPASEVRTGPPFDVADPAALWMEALGDVLLIGDRTTGQAWSMDFSGDGLVVEELADDARVAVPVGRAGADPADATHPDPGPTAAPTDD